MYLIKDYQECNKDYEEIVQENQENAHSFGERANKKIKCSSNQIYKSIDLFDCNNKLILLFKNSEQL